MKSFAFELKFSRILSSAHLSFNSSSSQDKNLEIQVIVDAFEVAMEFAVKHPNDRASSGLMTPTSRQVAFEVGVFRFMKG